MDCKEQSSIEPKIAVWIIRSNSIATELESSKYGPGDLALLRILGTLVS